VPDTNTLVRSDAMYDARLGLIAADNAGYTWATSVWLSARVDMDADKACAAYLFRVQHQENAATPVLAAAGAAERTAGMEAAMRGAYMRGVQRALHSTIQTRSQA
jgi:hypothetical protein